ncbi:MAG TPA: phosphotransferase [Solirubrobacteraceae bacterium]|nr:phosphotransferase [Solirubrobacteraceae bacterium]
MFATRDLDRIMSLLDRFCVSEIGAGISELLFRATSVGVVVGARLDDGRRVVLKAHQPRENRARLLAVHEIQDELCRAGLPCPQPLVAPVALVNGHVTAETLIDDGEFRDTHEPICRRLIAQALAWQLAITGSRSAPAALVGGWSFVDRDRLWPVHAHSPIFDFDATGAGAEWIDAFGREAKAAIVNGGRLIAGHSDWSGKHFRFADDRITAIYDWDSLAVRTEAELVGVAAMTYTTRFDLAGVARAPTPEEMNAFLDEYSAARGAHLTRTERGQIAAHGLLLAAYTARCEHCGIDGYDADRDPASFTAALRTHGDAYLQL